MRGALVALVLASGACSKPKPESPPPPRPTTKCPNVADHLVSLMSGAAKHPPEAVDPLRRVIGTRCEEDRWSADAQQCLLDLASLADGARCQAMMTAAQVEAFQRDSEAAMIELRGQLVEPAAAGSETPIDAGVDAP
jgi:hypothetical protein